jgi:hypothetical protein
MKKLTLTKNQQFWKDFYKAAAEKNDWKDAIIEACIVSCLDWDEDDPEGTLTNLINWECEMALDPRISEQAAFLATPCDDSPLTNGKLITEAHFERQITSKEAAGRYEQERKRCIEIAAKAYCDGISFTLLYGSGQPDPKGILNGLDTALADPKSAKRTRQS